MTNDGGGLAHEVWKAFESSPLGQALASGGVGGLVAWWVIDKEKRRNPLLKQIALGAVVAAFTGSGGAAAIKIMFGVELGAIAVGFISPAAFLVGMMFPAWLEKKLSELSGGNDDKS